MGHPMNITVVLHVISHGTENCSIIAGEHQYELVSSEQAAIHSICRACGHIFCDDCSKNKIALGHLGYSRPERVCV